MKLLSDADITYSFSCAKRCELQMEAVIFHVCNPLIFPEGAMGMIWKAFHSLIFWPYISPTHCWSLHALAHPCFVGVLWEHILQHTINNRYIWFHVASEHSGTWNEGIIMYISLWLNIIAMYIAIISSKMYIIAIPS